MEDKKVIITKESQALQYAASKDMTRFSIVGVQFNCKHVIATDGHMLAIRKKNDIENIKNTNLVFQQAKQKTIMKGVDHAEYKTVDNRQAISTTGQVAEVNDCIYPEYTQVINPIIEDSEERVSVSLNLALLEKIGKAMELSGKDKYINLSISTDTSKAIVVSAEDSETVALLMPLNQKDTHNALDKFREVVAD